MLSLEEIPEIPSELAGIWAYIMWESAGCPQRSQDAADREYREGIAELQQCLCRGKTLDVLWQVPRAPPPPPNVTRQPGIGLDAFSLPCRRDCVLVLGPSSNSFLVSATVPQMWLGAARGLMSSHHEHAEALASSFLPCVVSVCGLYMTWSVPCGGRVVFHQRHLAHGLDVRAAGKVTVLRRQ